jgi:hypothetical protein
MNSRFVGEVLKTEAAFACIVRADRFELHS